MTSNRISLPVCLSRAPTWVAHYQAGGSGHSGASDR
jgi:hypothetical protein